MYPEVRFALIALALAAALAAGYFAQKIASENLTIRRTWTSADADVIRMPATNYVEVQLADERRIVLTPTHSLGLSLFKKVPIYLDPADPNRAEFGGLLQMWLWPATLIAAAMVCLLIAVTFARAGHSDSGGGWKISSPPPQIQTDIRVQSPSSEWKAPLFWSLLGFAALGIGVFARSAPTPSRVGYGLIGSIFILAMFSLSLERMTMQVRADAQRIRKSSAFGWVEVPWEKIARLEQQTVIPDERGPGYLYRRLPFPGNSVESYVFRDHDGRSLFSISFAMGPAEPMYRLLELCREKTGASIDKKTIRAPIF